ncbi:MAG: cation transporter [Crocinitomicaceae bacterium]|nr:cation transporter [Crocinitomicaceae bacterium]
MDHEHHHASKNLRTAFFLNLGFTIFEIIGGFYVNSVAIISDAVHDLGDSFSLGTSWYLQNKSGKAANDKFTFGYKRLSLLGALINSLILIAGSVYVVIEAVGRIIEPEHSNAQGMLIFAIIGVGVNGYAAWKLSSGKTLNERVLTWHLLEDVLGWVAILIVSIVLLFKDIQYLDPALSLFITAYILWNVVKRLKETVLIFLQAHPVDIDRDELEQKIQYVNGVQSLHHVHIWSLDGEHHVFTAHVSIEGTLKITDLLRIKSEIKKIIKNYPFEHYTIELEFDEENCEFVE